MIAGYLKRYDGSDIVSKVRSSIIDWLPSRMPSQETIAQAINTSPRISQRKLSAQRQIAALPEPIHNELARRYLTTRRSIGEVAYLLGFNAPVNFALSFKKRTGQTPIQFLGVA